MPTGSKCEARPCGRKDSRLARFADYWVRGSSRKAFYRWEPLHCALVGQLLVRGVVFATRSAASGLLAALQIGPQNFREALGACFLGRRLLVFFF